MTTKYLFILSATLFFLPAIFAYADIGTSTTQYSVTTGTNNTVFGNASSTLGICVRFGTSSPTYVNQLKINLYKTGAPTDDLQAFLAIRGSSSVNTYFTFATSTNTINGTTLTTGTAEYTFNFATTAYTYYNRVDHEYTGDLRSTGWGAVCVKRLGGISATDYYRVTRNTSITPSLQYPTGAQVSEAWQTASVITGIRATISGYEYVGSVGGGGSCPEGYECYTLEEMASTTEAVYTVGSTLQIYLGIMLMIVFGIMAYNFTRRFI